MIKTYTYKLYSNTKVESKFYKWLGVCRCVYNLAKETKETVYSSGITLTKYNLQKQLPELKNEFEWIKEVHSQTLQVVVERLDNSYKKFFKDLKRGVKVSKPKWASKNKWRSFGFPQNVKQTTKGFKLPKFGEVKVHNNRKIDGNIKTARLIKKADGIYINVVAEVEDKVFCNNENQVGIDMGITYFLTTSDGQHIENPRFLQSKFSKLRIEQRKLSRSKKGSERRKRQIQVVQRLHKKVTDCRMDFLHKVSTELSQQYSTIAIEDLNIKEMIQGDYARSISDVSWGKFFELLGYKSNNLIKVNPAYTSQTCPSCNHISKENRKTQSKFECIDCGFEENADIVGAININKLGRTFPNSTQSRSVDPACTVDSYQL